MSFIDKLVKSLLTEDRMARLDLRPETQEDRDEQEPLIEFFCEPQWKGVFPEPELAMKNIADWWKKIPMDLKPEHVPAGQPMPRDHHGGVAMTAKRCMPLLDGMSVGYTLFTPVDINIRVSADGKLMEISENKRYNGASKHDIVQLGGKTSPTYPGPAIKFHNPWVIKTRPGVSTLFIPPLNHVSDESRFICLGAAVDTDKYAKQINFPGIWLAKGFEGQIKAGTPLITAIPYRRKDVEREIIVRNMRQAERLDIGKKERIQDTRASMYTKELRIDRRDTSRAAGPKSIGMEEE